MNDTSFGICAMEAILTLNTGGERVPVRKVAYQLSVQV